MLQKHKQKHPFSFERGTCMLVGPKVSSLYKHFARCLILTWLERTKRSKHAAEKKGIKGSLRKKKKRFLLRIMICIARMNEVAKSCCNVSKNRQVRRGNNFNRPYRKGLFNFLIVLLYDTRHLNLITLSHFIYKVASWQSV